MKRTSTTENLKMGLPAIVGMSGFSNWGSCKVITPNLLKSYEQIYSKNYNYFGYDPDMIPIDSLTLARRIISTRPKRIIFLDHMPHPELLIRAFESIGAISKLPPVDFHLYGDFTLYTIEWLRIESILKQMNLRFFCASPRQMKLVQSMQKRFKNVFVVPFPADPHQYNFDREVRSQFRKQNDISDDQKLICYTGRMSLQKNIIQLGHEVVNFMRQNANMKIKFLLAGTFDNLGAPFFGKQSEPGDYFKRWSEWHKSLPLELRQNIRYMGQLDSHRLNELYNASDLFVSLSTHHDEDFGMSPLEALFCGCPALLSSWGGYEGFGIDAGSCITLPLKLQRGAYIFSSKSFQENASNLLLSSYDRRNRSKVYVSKFSIKAVANLIERSQNLKEQKFTGWSDLMVEHAYVASQFKVLGRMYEPYPKKSSLYCRLYQSYFKD